jgi:hypothetical protein
LCRQMWDGCSDISVRLQAHKQTGRFRVNGLCQTKHCDSVPVGMKTPLLRIRDVYPGFRIPLFPSRIPDPGSELSPSRIRIKEFKYFNPKKSKKWFLSSRKYDPGCSSRIPDPGVEKAPDPGSQIWIRNTGSNNIWTDLDQYSKVCKSGTGI